MGNRRWEVREPGGLLSKVWRGPYCCFQAAGSVPTRECFPELSPYIFLHLYCLSPSLWCGACPSTAEQVELLRPL